MVPIEDSEYTPSSIAPVKSPVRTDMTKKQDNEEKDCVMVDKMSIPLPGTPTNDHEGEEGGGSQQKSPRSRETVGHLALNIDSGDSSQENAIPDSPKSSESFSSRGSTKSTDVLLPREKQ